MVNFYKGAVYQGAVCCAYFVLILQSKDMQLVVSDVFSLLLRETGALFPQTGSFGITQARQDHAGITLHSFVFHLTSTWRPAEIHS